VGAGLQRDDDYQRPGKPACDWDDPAAREELVDGLFRDGYRALFALRGMHLGPDATQAAELFATVIGQDIQETGDGRFVIAEWVAPDRIISLADPQARHGHKTAAHGFDGYKAHLAVDPDCEIITAAEVGPANGGDAAMAQVLPADLPAASPGGGAATEPAAGPELVPVPVVYGDSAYGTGQVLAHLDRRGITPMTKAFPEAKRRVPALRMVVVTGPRIDPGSLPRHDGLEVRAYVHELYRHLAACDLAVVQGGLTTCMELTANRRPFLYFPLAHHFEQHFHVAHRLNRYRAGRRMDYATSDPDAIAAAIAAELGRPVDYRPVETDGAARAANLIAQLI
jgi:hypothetical protein